MLLGVDRPTAELDERVARRVARMFADGLVAETRDLLDRGLRDGRTASRALGYQQVVAALDGCVRLTRGATSLRRPSRRCAPRGGSSAGSARGSVATVASCWLDPGPGPARAGRFVRCVRGSAALTGIPFSKGHGTENDFVVLPDPDGVLDLTDARVAALCDRRRGLGADGVLRVVRWAALKDDAFPAEPGVEWFMDYRNADGSVAEMCGNGVRVYAHWLDRAGWLTDGGTLALGTRGRDPPGAVARRRRSPSTWARRASGPCRPLTWTGGRSPGLAVDVGNPHLACVTDVALDDAGPDRGSPGTTARCSRTG